MCDKTSEKHVTLADRVLKAIQDKRETLSVYLVNGFQLKGEIVEFDEEAILIKLKDTHQLVMRSGVASLYPVLKSKAASDEWWSSYTTTDSNSTC